MWEWLTSSDAADFGQFVGALLTGISLILAFYIILRDRRNREREQVEQLVLWYDHVNGKLPQYKLRNLSDKPIMMPTLMVRSLTRLEKVMHLIRRRRVNWNDDPFSYQWSMGQPNTNVMPESIAPGETAAAVEPVRFYPEWVNSESTKVMVSVHDARGKVWLLNHGRSGIRGRRALFRETETCRRLGVRSIAKRKEMSTREFERHTRNITPSESPVASDSELQPEGC